MELAVVWEQSWLVSMYMDCPPSMGWTCPNATAVSDFKEAVQRGDIWWHAYPHNAQMEVMDESLLAYGVTLTHELDALFGLPPKITLSQACPMSSVVLAPHIKS